jgi:hypothetical protein
VRNGELEMKAAAVGSQQHTGGEVFEFGRALVSSVRSMGTGPCLCMHMGAWKPSVSHRRAHSTAQQRWNFGPPPRWARYRVSPWSGL